MASGIHHVTLITRRVQANVDFYAGFLGLRLVKRTGGYEDALQLHLFYGDSAGAPGSLVTFLVWEDGAPGRVGHGQVTEIAFAVAQNTLGNWLTRAIAHGVKAEGPMREFGEPVLRLKDPDGVIVKLVGMPDLAGEDAPARLRAVTIWSEVPEETAAFIEQFGYRKGPLEGSVQRLLSDTDAVDVRDANGFVAGIPGTGVADHVAFRAADVDEVMGYEKALSRRNSSVTNFHDRKYFHSLYVREPAGTLIEVATDGPGLAIDEMPGRLGQKLFVPPQDAERAEDIRVMLPQFAMPGEERLPLRDLPFVHRFYHPETPDGSTMLLLHGTGGNEADLMPFARRLNPNATLLGVRGRAAEEGVARWFRRFSTVSFDQADIRSEAEAFEAFLHGAVSGYGLDPGRITVVGYSNGANFAAAVMALRPGLIGRAILMRAMAVLDVLPEVNLGGTQILMLNGNADPYGAQAPRLQEWLKKCGAALEVATIEAGHELTAADQDRAGSWAKETSNALPGMSDGRV